MSVEQITVEQLQNLLEPSAWEQVRLWLDRGDGVAVYQGQALDHSTLGHHKFVSYGSPTALFESTEDPPPKRLPDINGEINWPYQLISVCRPSKEEAWATHGV